MVDGQEGGDEGGRRGAQEAGEATRGGHTPAPLLMRRERHLETSY